MEAPLRTSLRSGSVSVKVVNMNVQYRVPQPLGSVVGPWIR